MMAWLFTLFLVAAVTLMWTGAAVWAVAGSPVLFAVSVLGIATALIGFAVYELYSTWGQ